MRVKFHSLEQLETWIDTISISKYDFYYSTLDRKLIAIKNVSTPPLLYAEVGGVPFDESEELVTNYNRPFVICAGFDWKDDSGFQQ